MRGVLITAPSLLFLPPIVGPEYLSVRLATGLVFLEWKIFASAFALV
jgi:hypothetical protein